MIASLAVARRDMVHVNPAIMTTRMVAEAREMTPIDSRENGAIGPRFLTLTAGGAAGECCVGDFC